MKRTITLETAISICRNNRVEFNWEWTGNHHIKFYIKGYPKVIIMSQGNKYKSEAIARSVRREVERAIATLIPARI